jgi:hypothetical protein
MNSLKDINLEELATRPSYRVLAKGLHNEKDRESSYDKYMELRQYPPCKRTIEIENVGCFLQFPSIAFLWTAVKYKVYKKRKDADSFLTGANFAAYVAKNKILTLNDIVYQAPLPNVFDFGRVCMPIPENASNDNMVEAFWQSAFRDYNYSDEHPRMALENNYGSLEDWKKLTLQQVEQKINWLPMDIKSLIKIQWMYPFDWFAGQLPIPQVEALAAR